MVILPSDLRDYFLTVNGMKPDTSDDALMRFWMLEELKPLPEGAPEYAGPSFFAEPQSVFLFADFSLWAHAYAIRLTADPAQTNDIFLIGFDSAILLLPSFSAFVRAYLTDKDRLFPNVQVTPHDDTDSSMRIR